MAIVAVRLLLVLFVLGSPLAVCAQAPSQAGLDKGFKLGAGRSARIADTDLTVRFDRVEADSRCPTDVQCITAGDAEVALSIAAGQAAAERHTVHTSREPRATTHGAFRIELVALDPAPVSTRETRESDYVLTLRVTRAASR
jgi:hypothetical protein